MKLKYQTRMFNRLFYWRIAIINALVVSLVFPVSSLLRIGYHREIFVREFALGFLFTIFVWWFNLHAFPFIEHKFFRSANQILKETIRVVSTLTASYLLIYLDERLGLFQINIDLGDYIYPEYGNEFRAVITAFIVLLLVFFMNLSGQYYKTRIENEKLKLENSIAQFEALKQQINPHFLFNSLNILKTMINSHDKKAEEYVLRLSELYRSLLISNQKEKIEISDELMALENYIYMLKARFQDKILIKIDIANEFRTGFIPPFTLQMLVENCIKHNIVSEKNPLTIELKIEDNQLVVRNNLQLKRSVEHSNNIGLNNINNRYINNIGKSITIVQDEDYFTVKLPLIS